MKTNPAMHQRRTNRGSTLLVTLIFATALLIIVAGLLSVVTTDKRRNTDVALADEARNAAEGAMEVATAEFDRRAVSDGTLADNPLSEFTFPADVQAALGQGHVQASSIAFKAGNLSPRPDKPEIINATDPFNASDPDKGKPVSIRHAFIYGKATAVHPVTGHSVTSYLSTLIQVRTQSWLNYGIFGNLDLEFHAGPTMDVLGPVHSNQNIYVLGGSALRLFGTCTTTKKIFRKFKDNGSTSSHEAEVKFATKANATASDLDAMTTSQDSRLADFKSFAKPKWNGFVQDVTFDVQAFNPPGMLQYIEDDYTTADIDETRNHAYAFIEPQLATVTVDDPANDTFAGSKGTQVENLKVSAVASLIIRIKRKPTGTSEADWWAKIGKQDNDDPAFEPGFDLVFHTLADPAKAPNRTNFPVRGGNGRPTENIIPLTPDRMSKELRNRLFAAIRLVQYREDISGASTGNGNLLYTEFKTELGSAINDDGSTSPGLTSSNRRRWYGIYDRRQGYVYPNGDSATANDGLRGAHHALHVDMDKFNDFLNAAPTEWKDVATPSHMLYNANVQWSGVLYVQFPLVPYSDPAVDARKTTDKIRPAQAPTATKAGYALILRNAGRLPVYADRTDDGFVVGCNGPVYVLGHYNADGLSSTGSSTAADPGWDEIPSIIAADAVTLLSQNYANTDSADESVYFKESCKPKKDATFTEFSSAVFAGVIPTRLTTSATGTNGQRMGGVHNFVRFLENWAGTTYRNRGSLALLFESEVSTRPYFENHHPYWYRPPTRDIGYHMFFASGRSPKAWPPFMRSDRRIKVDPIRAADYAAGPPTPE